MIPGQQFPVRNGVDSELQGASGDISGLVRTLRIIVGALIAGDVCFAAVASFLAFNAPPQPGQKADALIAYLAAGFAAVTLIARIIVPQQVASKMIQQATTGKSPESITKELFYPVYQSTLIIASALLNGAVFFNLIALIISHQPFSLGIAAVLVAVMATGFPSAEKIKNWSEEQLRKIQLEHV